MNKYSRSFNPSIEPNLSSENKTPWYFEVFTVYLFRKGRFMTCSCCKKCAIIQSDLKVIHYEKLANRKTCVTSCTWQFNFELSSGTYAS